jgi:hypothetical protein
MNKELQSMWKEAVVAYFEAPYLEAWSTSWKFSVVITGIQAKMCIQGFQNTKIKFSSFEVNIRYIRFSTHYDI